MFTQKFKITNVDCPACIKLSKNALEDIAGVENLEISDDGVVNLAANREIDWEEIASALKAVGKSAEKN